MKPGVFWIVFEPDVSAGYTCRLYTYVHVCLFVGRGRIWEVDDQRVVSGCRVAVGLIVAGKNFMSLYD